LEAVDDADDVELDGLVHVDQALVPAFPRVREKLAGAVEVVAVYGQMLGGGEDVVAGSATRWVRAGLLQRQEVGAVGERLRAKHGVRGAVELESACK
jgi:hypothetical protein